MKQIKLIFISVLVLGISFSSCTKEAVPVDMSLIVGKWNFNKTSFSQGVITLPESEYSGNEAGCNKDYIEILAGGVAKAGDYSTACAFSQKVGTWVATDSSLTVAVTDSTLGGVFQVVSVSNTEMVLKFTTTQNGTTVNVTQSFTKG